MNQRCQRCLERLNSIDKAACKVKLLEIRWQVFDASNLIICQIQDLKVLKSHQLHIHALNVVFLGIE